ncbi:hypothetical protein, partial [Mycobacterium avium]|uniref:hypothetical protein n=1 Tax=Mycobacterium avium TaxID=1764 RepID=UPI001F2490A2
TPKNHTTTSYTTPLDYTGVIANSFGRQIAVALDYAALRGTGVAPVPLGALNTPNAITITNGPTALGLPITTSCWMR